MNSSDASHLTTGKSEEHSKLIGEIKLKPAEQKRLKLGSFTKNSPPKGFSTEFTPDPDPPGSVITQVTDMGTGEQYELFMHIANYSNKPVAAKVWML